MDLGRGFNSAGEGLAFGFGFGFGPLGAQLLDGSWVGGPRIQDHTLLGSLFFGILVFFPSGVSSHLGFRPTMALGTDGRIMGRDLEWCLLVERTSFYQAGPL
ncbi:hypothetical protein F5144DRAFT_587367 [Chaetomium tenue]|uniref:Uncharacterized protein n=1 Tax=Chaetomium tenue TaxID=1854479 RepID=A0ACB7NUA5_9PEZI|nr:hypothetical protein F5144DRAFT_587367 [Chaetomium globosum]